MIDKIAIGSDHAGYDMKQAVIKHLEGKGIAVKDYGTYSADSVDYPDYAHQVAEAIEKGEFSLAIVLCGSANGVCMTVNKHNAVRGAIAWQRELAELARQHNNANVLCLPARFIDEDTMVACVDGFLAAEFEGGRHSRRVDKISCA